LTAWYNTFNKNTSLQKETELRQGLEIELEVSREHQKSLEQQLQQLQETIKHITDVGNEQFGELASKAESIRALESDVISIFSNPFKLFLNSITRRDFHSLTKKNWIEDTQVSCCQDSSCDQNFGLFNRKHHCRKYNYN
jgi:NADPH-dependent 7-cyano-7-deazaguanine reductase QueF-like protein